MTLYIKHKITLIFVSDNLNIQYIMKTLNLLKYLLVIVLYLNLQSCSKEETPAVPSLPAEEKTIITCETKELTFEYKGGTQTFSFSTNKDWTVKVLGSATWCKLSQTKGIAGMATINVTTEENVTYNDRNITLTINMIIALCISNNIISNILIFGSLIQSMMITKIAYKITNNKYGYEVYAQT